MGVGTYAAYVERLEKMQPNVYMFGGKHKRTGKYLKGVIVRGAKVCNSIAPYADEIIALPTKFMAEGDESYAVAFALPGDWDGIKLMALPSTHHSR
jgi:aromatic ring hydroxylase